MFLEIEKSRTYKRDSRTSFWVSIKYDPTSGYRIYVAKCLKNWFAYRFPLVFTRAKGKWLLSSHGWSYIEIDFFDSIDLDWAKIDRILQFLGNECFWPNILKPTCGAPSFLDVCIARDYTSDTNDLSHWTQMGGLFHIAKYQNNLTQSEKDACVLQLSNAVAEMIDCTLGISDGLTKAQFPGVLISPMPVEYEKRFENFDYKLCVNISGALGLPLVTPVIDWSRKKQVKGMSLSDKCSYWDALISDRCISVDDVLVRNKIIILVDDLYQSGLSMEKMAEFLKSCGAYKVYGFACVKAMRDSDNT